MCKGVCVHVHVYNFATIHSQLICSKFLGIANLWLTIADVTDAIPGIQMLQV